MEVYGLELVPNRQERAALLAELTHLDRQSDHVLGEQQLAGGVTRSASRAAVGVAQFALADDGGDLLGLPDPVRRCRWRAYGRPQSPGSDQRDRQSGLDTRRRRFTESVNFLVMFNRPLVVNGIVSILIAAGPWELCCGIFLVVCRGFSTASGVLCMALLELFGQWECELMSRRIKAHGVYDHLMGNLPDR
ncbi:hypothetical protein [Actinophytocola xinjiangensis]|uniref:hypothetical protein n=1 Tax=Actinophytocola xinjiangensis TaxID=485602 RepID=UPI0012B82209|nr:hypothetical protein [Actinophytocola xinjiangensis]